MRNAVLAVALILLVGSRGHGGELTVTALLAARDLDAAFVVKDLLETLAKSGARVDARLVVACHHDPGENRPGPGTGAEARVQQGSGRGGRA